MDHLQALLDHIDKGEASFYGCATVFQTRCGVLGRNHYFAFKPITRAALKGRAFLAFMSDGKPAIHWLDELQPLPGRGVNPIRIR